MIKSIKKKKLLKKLVNVGTHRYQE